MKSMQISEITPGITIMTTGTLALIIIAVILVQLIILALVGYYRRKGMYHDAESRLETHLEPVSQSPPVIVSGMVEKTAAWDGFREFIVQRRVMEDVAESICSFYLVPVDGLPLPPFKPGQFLTFKLWIDPYFSTNYTFYEPTI